MILKKFSNLFKKEKPVEEVETKTSWTDKDDAEAFTADAKRHYEPYIGVPAPDYLPEDPWFPAPVFSEKQLTVKEAHEQAVADKQILDESESKESAEIHQKLYELSSKNWTTVGETQFSAQGGSENFQEGPGSWNSGTGMRQFYGQ